jgi:hypothetical protein
MPNSMPGVCPAIGWSSSVTVTLEGAVGAVNYVEFCAEGVCSSPAPTAAPAESIAPLLPSPDALPTSSPTPRAIYSPYVGRKVDERGWQFSVGMGAPRRATVRAFAADGTVLGERDVDLEWTRVGGTEQCGGPAVAGPIALRV